MWRKKSKLIASRDTAQVAIPVEHWRSSDVQLSPMTLKVPRCSIILIGSSTKLDGFRALAHIEGHHCRLISRSGHTFKDWPYLEVEVAHSIRCESAILAGAIACLDDDGRSNFHKLLFRREWPHFFAFDLLKVDGDNLRPLPLIQRKRPLKAIMPNVESRLRYVEHIEANGSQFYRLACEHDLEGIVAKWKFGTYRTDGAQSSWIK